MIDKATLVKQFIELGIKEGMTLLVHSSLRRVGKVHGGADTKIDALADKVEKHNSMIERTYQLEGRMTEAEHDIKDLKGYHKPSN